MDKTNKDKNIIDVLIDKIYNNSLSPVVAASIALGLFILFFIGLSYLVIYTFPE